MRMRMCVLLINYATAGRAPLPRSALLVQRARCLRVSEDRFRACDRCLALFSNFKTDATLVISANHHIHF